MRKSRTLLNVDQAGMRVADALAAGHSRDHLRRDVDAGRLERPYRGVVAAPGETSSLERLRAAMAHIGPESTAIIGSAALLHGLEGVADGAVPQLAVPPGLEKRQRAGIDLHFWDLTPVDLATVMEVPTTSVHRTLADACRLMSRWRAVALVDSALHLGLISEQEFDAVAALMARRRHCVTGRRTLRLARSGAQSPLESRVRLIATDAGLPPDGLQIAVCDDAGQVLGYADMGYRLAGGGLLVVEADGLTVHSAPAALLHDRRRQNAFLAVPGVTIVRFTWADTQVPQYIPSVLRPLLSRACWRPGRRP